MILWCQSACSAAALKLAHCLFARGHLLVVPTMLGGGKRVRPSNVCVRLDLLDERRFTYGTVYLRYHTQAVAPGSERSSRSERKR
jgi:hypothetical protein